MEVSHNEGRIQASKIISDGANQILIDWEAEVRKEVAAARKQNRIALIDSLPKFLKKMSETLACENPRCEAEVNADVAEEHGEERALQNDYTLDQMINEYQVLRTAILNYLDKCGQFDHQSNLIINDFIDRGMKKACAKYSSLVAEKQLEQIVAVGLLQKASEKNEIDLSKIVRVLEQERESRDRFIATLTHDLRTPLTSAKIGAQLIVRKLESKEIVTLTANRIISSMDRADRMIRDLLDANRLKTGETFPLKIIELNLGELVIEVALELIQIYGDRFNTSKVSPIVWGAWDPSGVRRIIENVVSNAIKYGDNHSNVELALESDKFFATILITNRGNPIPSTEIDTIFDPYKRASSAISGAQIGWGVGLTLVKGITEAHGGEVKVTSSASEGTTFIIKLPKNNHVE